MAISSYEKTSARSRTTQVDDFFVGNPMFDFGAVPAQNSDGIREVVLEDNHDRARMTKNRGQLRFGKADVERHQDRARLDHAEVAFEQLVVVVAEVGHAIARRDAELLQAGREPLRALSELGVGELPVPGDDADSGSVQIHGAMQAAKGRERNEHMRLERPLLLLLQILGRLLILAGARDVT